MLLVTILGKFILNLQLNLSKKYKGPLFIRRHVYFLALEFIDLVV